MHSEFDSEVISSQIFQKIPDLFVFMPFKQAKTCFLKNLHWDIFWIQHLSLLLALPSYS